MSDDPVRSDPAADDLARTRFLIIQLVRTGSAIFILFGMLVIASRTNLPELAGYPITLGGMFGTFIAPILLARRWKSANP
jgi:hypothetical protein